MDDSRMGGESRRVSGLALNDQVVAALQAGLPEVAERTVAAVTVEVPSYADAFSGRMGQRIESAVQMALGAFLQLAARSDESDPGPPLSACARWRLRTRPRRGTSGTVDGRAAGGLPCRCPSGMA